MKPRKFIKEIQQKSRSTRLLVLWLATFLIMIVIIVIWLASFSKSFQINETKEETEVTNLPSLFKSIEKDFSLFKQKLEASIGNIKSE